VNCACRRRTLRERQAHEAAPRRVKPALSRTDLGRRARRPGQGVRYLANGAPKPVGSSEFRRGFLSWRRAVPARLTLGAGRQSDINGQLRVVSGRRARRRAALRGRKPQEQETVRRFSCLPNLGPSLRGSAVRKSYRSDRFDRISTDGLDTGPTPNKTTLVAASCCMRSSCTTLLCWVSTQQIPNTKLLAGRRSSDLLGGCWVRTQHLLSLQGAQRKGLTPTKGEMLGVG
jgi:hypothetical protein